ncbi:DUF565 domain-containing protein [Prochlorococcus sp. MIT 1341]|uniref:DUF565 domain-containing protein n=1 Tax=Prochlorococcus sp. MIT 1341 TaxID=3096221 RepID=UPI002A7634B7|nr:DUF565 domain-containing protein [Prochlorococcus sp. MIT 1341]
MVRKLQDTGLYRNIGMAIDRLESWTINPWRRFSLLLIVLFSAFLIGSSIGMINGVLALMDPIGAFFTVLILEIMVRARGVWIFEKRGRISGQLIDVARIGLLYGLLLEGFKLL